MDLPAGVNCTLRRVGDVTILDVSGRIVNPLGGDRGRTGVLYGMILEQIAKGESKIIVNLREVSHVDSHGLGDMLACFTAVRNRGGQIRICSPTQRVLGLMRITCLDTVLCVDPDEAAALRALSDDQQKVTSP